MIVHRIAIFASGNGTNAENIARYFLNHEQIQVCTILTNNPQAGVLERAEKLKIPSFVFNKSDFIESDKVLEFLHEQQITFIVLAGFLWKIPVALLQNFPNKIINIHPALLPKYGGKGMYGEKVHQAVKDNLDKETGISIHYVNEHYDEGQVIFQARCTINPESESAHEIAEKVHALEYKHFPEVIENLLLFN
ncbi:phosphoribosylglycinamide formyltransferase [Bacteroidota bacterium]